jgi:hydroxymethylpyrimidine pyrophosphatase-like HAD family hydrolase
MKNLFITENGAIAFNPDTQEAFTVRNERQAIRNIFLVKEPTRVVYTSGTTKQEVYAEADDIIVEFYRGTEEFSNKIVVVKSAQWVDNLNAYNKAEQKRLEEWAAKKAAESTKDTNMCDEGTDESDMPANSIGR